MQHVRHALPTALIAAALAAGTAACDPPVAGSAYATGTATPTVTPDPLAGLTGDQITRRAIADLNNTASVRFAGTVTESGQSASMDMTLVRGQGCEGSVTLHGKGTLRMVHKGTSVWIQPSKAFYRSLGVSAAKISLLSGKWLKESQSGSSGLSSTCSLNDLAGSLGAQDTGMVRGAITSLGGRPAVIVTQTGEPGDIYISDTAKPELLRISASSGPDRGDITFSDYGLTATITPPPASKTLNGGEMGPEIGPIMV